jgi:hypothetical protein
MIDPLFEIDALAPSVGRWLVFAVGHPEASAQAYAICRIPRPAGQT